MTTCDLEHPLTYCCADPYCHTMQSELMGRTIYSVYRDLREGLYNGCPMLLAQGLESLLGRADRMAVNRGRVRRHGYGITEAHVVMNLPPQLYYRVNEMGEGVIKEYDHLNDLSNDEVKLLYEALLWAKDSETVLVNTREAMQKLWEKLP